MYKRFKIFLCTLLSFSFSFTLNAEPVLSVSYVKHPAVQATYLPVVKAMYEKANVTIQLFEVSNSPRSVETLNDGFFDADIGKVLSSIKDHENIIYIPTPIATVGLYLICRREVVCNKTILDDDRKIIISRFSKKMLTNILPINAGVAQILSQHKINTMLSIGRVNYSLVADDINSGASNFHDKFTVFLVSKEPYYHILHKKHQKIVPKLDLALKKILTVESK